MKKLILSMLAAVFVFGAVSEASAETAFKGTWEYSAKGCFDRIKIRKNGRMNITVSGKGSCYNDKYTDRIKAESSAGFRSRLLDCRVAEGGLLCAWPNCESCKGRDLFRRIK